MEFIVDFQGYKSGDEFIFKEVAIVSIQEDAQPTVLLFAPPHTWDQVPVRNKSENNWIYRNYFGIPWNDGDIPYKELESTLCTYLMGDSKVYVKGLEKQRWLKNIISHKILDLEDYDCPSLKKCKTEISCSHHKQNYCLKYHCAVRQAVWLKEWLVQYYKSPFATTFKEINENARKSFDEID